jgi:hypothetical protein
MTLGVSPFRLIGFGSAPGPGQMTKFDKKSTLDEKLRFFKKIKLHWSYVAHCGGNWSKMVFFGQKLTFIVKME